MKLSRLQQFILKESYNSRNYRISRENFLSYYDNKVGPKKELFAKIITGSLENMIDKGLAIGYGRRTPEKWFIEEIRLTESGVKQARHLLGEQLLLPMKKSKTTNN